MTAKTSQEAHARLMATLPVTTHLRTPKPENVNPYTGKPVQPGHENQARALRDSRAKAGGRVNTLIARKP